MNLKDKKLNIEGNIWKIKAKVVKEKNISLYIYTDRQTDIDVFISDQ